MTVRWAAVAAAVLVATGCTQQQEAPPSTTPSTLAPITLPTPLAIPATLPAGMQVDRSSVDAVAQAFGQLWYSYAPRDGETANSGSQRAATLADPALRAKVAASGAGSVSVEDAKLRQAGAVVTARTGIGREPRPADTPTTALRSVTVTQTTTPDVLGTGPVFHLIDLRLVRTGSDWSVATQRERS